MPLVVVKYDQHELVPIQAIRSMKLDYLNPSVNNKLSKLWSTIVTLSIDAQLPAPHATSKTEQYQSYRWHGKKCLALQNPAQSRPTTVAGRPGAFLLDSHIVLFVFLPPPPWHRRRLLPPLARRGERGRELKLLLHDAKWTRSTRTKSLLGHCGFPDDSCGQVSWGTQEVHGNHLLPMPPNSTLCRVYACIASLV